MTVVQNPHCIVNFYGAHTTSENPFFVMEFFERGSLEDVIQSYVTLNKKMDFMTLINFAYNASVGIQYLHHKKIIHRDIKTANFLIGPKNSIKLIDFGVSRVQNNKRMSVTGTPVWMAPELLMGQRNYTEKADIYSMSLVYWSMISGKLPYYEIPILELTDSVSGGKHREQIPPGTHPALVDIIKRGWDDNPDNRPSIDEIVNILYELKDPKTQRYCVKAHEHVSNDIFQKIFTKMDTLDLICVFLTSKRFYEIASPISKGRHKGCKVIIGKIRFSYCEKIKAKPSCMLSKSSNN